MSRLVGLISDTHGLLLPAAVEALDGVDLVLHAGDVGNLEVLSVLGGLAPVHAVWGNTDPPGAPHLVQAVRLDVEDVSIHVSHGHELGSPTPERLVARYDADVVVYGHTHRALVRRLGRQLVVNPGAAGPRRFGLAQSVALLHVDGREVRAEIVTWA